VSVKDGIKKEISFEEEHKRTMESRGKNTELADVEQKKICDDAAADRAPLVQIGELGSGAK
jgi:hypothetical protein